MLAKAAITDDKDLQQRQIQKVDKWFSQNLEVVNYRTRPPLHQKFKSVNNKDLMGRGGSLEDIQNMSPIQKLKALRQKQSSQAKKSVKKNFINSKDIMRDLKREQSQESIGGGNLDASNSSIIKRGVDSKASNTQVMSNTGFMSKRLEKTKKEQPQSTFILCDYEYGSNDYMNQLNKMLTQTTQSSMSRTKVQQQIKNHVMEWSMQKRMRQSVNLHRGEILQNSNFDKLGISIRSQAQTTMGGTRSNFRKNSNLESPGQSEKQNEEKEDPRKKFLDFDNDEDLRSDFENSNDNINEVNLLSQTCKHSQDGSRFRLNPRRIIDLTKEDITQFGDVFEHTIKDSQIMKKPLKLPPELEGYKLPPPPMTLNQLKQKINYTPSLIKSIEAKALHKLRQNRTNIVFNLSTQLNSTKIEDSQPNESVLKVEDLLNQTHQSLGGSYPLINQEKQNIDSAVIGSSHQDVITLSCFTRPTTVGKIKPQNLNISMLPSISNNLKLLSKQNNNHLEELQEIEQIKKVLSKNDVPLGTEILSKAILYENERQEINDRDIIKRYHSQPHCQEINYPKMGDFLLKNPFEKEKESKKKKKKK